MFRTSRPSLEPEFSYKQYVTIKSGGHQWLIIRPLFTNHELDSKVGTMTILTNHIHEPLFVLQFNGDEVKVVDLKRFFRRKKTNIEGKNATTGVMVFDVVKVTYMGSDPL